MRILEFMFKGELYQVDEQGRIKANNLEYFSDDWIFLGGSSHHWHNGITVHRADAFENPSLLNGCLGWDIDHGTTRRWVGQYNGKLPRITNTTVVETATYRKMTEEDFEKYAAFTGSMPGHEAYISDDVVLSKDGETFIVIADNEGVCLHSESDTYCLAGDLDRSLWTIKHIVKQSGKISVDDLLKVGFF